MTERASEWVSREACRDGELRVHGEGIPCSFCTRSRPVHSFLLSPACSWTQGVPQPLSITALPLFASFLLLSDDLCLGLFISWMEHQKRKCNGASPPWDSQALQSRLAGSLTPSAITYSQGAEDGVGAGGHGGTSSAELEHARGWARFQLCNMRPWFGVTPPLASRKSKRRWHCLASASRRPAGGEAGC